MDKSNEIGFDAAQIRFTANEQVLVAPVAIKLMQGLLYSHFARRGRGRPRRNSDIPRLMEGYRKLIKASGVSLSNHEETAILEQLLNKSLF